MDALDGGAFVIGRIRVEDAARWPAYRDRVPATLEPFGGTVVVRGRGGQVFAGVTDETDVVVLHFPSMDAAERWYRSDAYQALIPLRDAAGDVVIVAYAL